MLNCEFIMTWNYRIIKHDKTKNVYFAVHEVYYDEKGSVKGWTEDPIDIVGDSKQEILNTLNHMVEDTKQPVLKESELEKDFSKTGKTGVNYE